MAFWFSGVDGRPAVGVGVGEQDLTAGRSRLEREVMEAAVPAAS